VRRHVVILGLAAFAVPLAAAHAQNAGGGASPGAGGSAQAPSASGSAAPTGRPATGYGYSKHKHGFVVRSDTRHHHRPSTHGQTGPIATLPGFEMLPGGGSRLFVELTQQVRVEERRSRGKLVYVLHGAHVAVRNNENPLVTIHFNTPVSRARLVPAGHNLHFVVLLRAQATPTWKTASGKDGTFMLTIDFPKGTYIHRARSR
jgi:hypothetical protein